MKTLVFGLVSVVGALWMASCAPLDQPAEGLAPSRAPRTPVPGVMHQGGMLDDEMNFGRTY